MPCGPLVHRAPAIGIVLRYMRRDVHPAKFTYEFLGVIILVSSLPSSLAFPPGSLRPSALLLPAPLFHSPRSETSAPKVRCDSPLIHVPGSPVWPRFFWTS